MTSDSTAETAECATSLENNVAAKAVGQIDNSIYVYDIPIDEYINVCYFLQKNNIWIEAARRMGYSDINIVKFKYYAMKKQKLPSDILLSNWSDQNHTVTELFMLLYRLQQFSALDCLRRFVNEKYHYLILKNQPKLEILLDTYAEHEKRYDNRQAELDRVTTCQVLHIPYAELNTATSNWSNDLVLGKGGFGIVYKGIWKNTKVAIKRIENDDISNENPRTKFNFQQILNELRILSVCRHDNILPLYGYSADVRDCIVFQYMPGGSLDHRLHNKSLHKSLTFSQRRNIAIGTARGLQYLHTFDTKPHIHGDIKPANILLDSNDVPKIGDFGLSRDGTFENMEVSRICGTRPYLPNEFLNNHLLSTKIDTYSYGVVLFELITELMPFDRNRNGNDALLVNYMQSIKDDPKTSPFERLIVDTMAIDQTTNRSNLRIIRIGLMCTKEEPKSRPHMVQVLQMLEKYIDE